MTQSKPNTIYNIEQRTKNKHGNNGVVNALSTLIETLDMHGIGICSNYWIVNPINNVSFGSGEGIIQSGGGYGFPSPRSPTCHVALFTLITLFTLFDQVRATSHIKACLDIGSLACPRYIIPF